MGGRRSGEQGFMLAGLMVACFLILLALTVAAPTMAYQIRREREVETQQRAQQYVRAIRLYYRKIGHYPGSIEQLEKTNNIRFLRQRYIDPMTGKDDWRFIGVGQNKTTVKGFFGQPLGPATSGIGGGLGSSPLGPGSGTGSSGATGAIGTGGVGGTGTGTSGSGTTGTGTSGSGTNGTSGGSTTSSGLSTSSGFGAGLGTSNLGTSNGASGPFMGVGLTREGNSILVVNDQSSYDTWEFLYDPRSEPRGNVNGGSSVNAGSLGSGGLGSGSQPGQGTSGTGPSGTGSSGTGSGANGSSGTGASGGTGGAGTGAGSSTH